MALDSAGIRTMSGRVLPRKRGRSGIGVYARDGDAIDPREQAKRRPLRSQPPAWRRRLPPGTPPGGVLIYSSLSPTNMFLCNRPACPAKPKPSYREHGWDCGTGDQLHIKSEARPV